MPPNEPMELSVSRDGIGIDVRVDGTVGAEMRPRQRATSVTRAVRELDWELEHRLRKSRPAVRGANRDTIAGDLRGSTAKFSEGTLLLQGQQVMQDWERPLMEAMVDAVVRPGGTLLEIGFGLGISASHAQSLGVGRHVIVESHPDVLVRALRWRGEQRDPSSVEIVAGRWQDTEDEEARFDAILFDTFPETEEQHGEWTSDPTYAAHFFPYAAAHLAHDGRFCYYTGEIDSIGRAHQRRLLEHFESFELRVVGGLTPPADCAYWFDSTMAVVVAAGPRSG